MNEINASATAILSAVTRRNAVLLSEHGPIFWVHRLRPAQRRLLRKIIDLAIRR